MGTVRIRNVGSFGREIRPDLDGVTLAVVEVGGVVEVSARLAGRAPGWQPTSIAADEDPPSDGRHYRIQFNSTTEDARWEFEDSGEGLLAQVGVWALESDDWVDPAAEHVDGQVIYSTPVPQFEGEHGPEIDAAALGRVIDVEPVKPTRAKATPEPLPTVPADTAKEG